MFTMMKSIFSSAMDEESGFMDVDLDPDDVMAMMEAMQGDQERLIHSDFCNDFDDDFDDDQLD